MSFNVYDLDSGLDSDDPTDFSRKAILYDNNDLNKLVIAGIERLNHFSAKAIFFFILNELGHDVTTECQIIGIGRIDLYDITAKVIYEFETTGCKKVQRRVNEIYKQTGVEVTVIDVRELPDDIKKRYLMLKEFGFND